jgi:hypothetical protein
MHDPEYAQTLAVLRRSHPALAEEVASFMGMNDVFGWMERRNLCQSPVDIITQDEFNSDFLIRLEEGNWVVFGIT